MVAGVAECGCPCQNSSLCLPVTDTTRKENFSLCLPVTDTTRREIFVFSLQDKWSSWERFDWRKVTTVVTVGYVSPRLMCLAHQHGARVVTIEGQPVVCAQSEGQSVVCAQSEGQSVVCAQSEGQSVVCAQSEGQSVVCTVRGAVCGVCTVRGAVCGVCPVRGAVCGVCPVSGAACGVHTNYRRSELTNATLRSQWVKRQLGTVRSNFYDGINIDFEDPIARNDSALRAGYTALVRETYQVFKHSDPHYQVTVDVAWSPNCIDGRCYDIPGLAQNTDFLFVMAYDEQSQIFAPTCTARANSPYSKTLQGLQAYLHLKVWPSQLVLGTPWYGYNYPCLSLSPAGVCTIPHRPFRGANCSDAAGRQLDYRLLFPLLVNQSTGGRHWDPLARSPFFNFRDPVTEQMHQVRYDDPTSLGLKYGLAEGLGLRGVGTWNIDCLDFSHAPYAREQTRLMFDALPTYPRPT
ncbi:hypothetical protein ACOMHN_010838 [Nucella lapillus]